MCILYFEVYNWHSLQ